jgi:hypothetical protein
LVAIQNDCLSSKAHRFIGNIAIAACEGDALTFLQQLEADCPTYLPGSANDKCLLRHVTSKRFWFG